MRLSKIKLAGFKSFVDPAVLLLPSNLVAVVGPNGCGKSNLIDAVRWVMGESSARSLRGETMSDVIFNGAASRKPVGQASVELVFDNAQGRLGGPWASYAEIAVKRLVGRDGQSSYFLNGTRCRRRDIADLFLGTGLGPRSYAIIEQGMISRIIEAKPEDLRAFLEEAAGISKYKERRRETEMRIRHTRENLDRLNDLRTELERQLQHLQRQARAASQYRDYRTEQRRLQAELAALRWRNLAEELHNREQALRQAETVLEAMIAEQRQWERQLETGRSDRITLNDHYNAAQGSYYQASAEITRLENYLQHQRDLQQRRAEDQRQAAATLAQLAVQQTQDRTQQQEWIQALSVAETALAQRLDQQATAIAALAAAEQAARVADAVWADYGRRESEIVRQADVERTRIQHLEQQVRQHERRLARLQQEQEHGTSSNPDEELLALAEQKQTLADDLRDAQEQLAAIEAELSAGRSALRQADLRIRLEQEQLQAGRGRLSSLQTLQEAALGRDTQDLQDWLQSHGLAQAPRLAEQLVVESGWETAVEAALADWLDAVCVADFQITADALAELNDGRLALFTPSSTHTVDASPSGLAAKIHAPWPLADLLAQVEPVADLADALARRHSLSADQTLVTPAGVLCGRHWLRWSRIEQASSGVLRREQEIHRLVVELAEMETALVEQSTTAEQLRTRLHEQLEQQQREAQQRVNQYHRDHANAQAHWQTAQARREQARLRATALIEEQEDLTVQLAQLREELALAQLGLADALACQQQLSAEQGSGRENRDHAIADLRQQREHAEAARQQVNASTVTVETLRTRLAGVALALERLNIQYQQALARQSHLVEADHDDIEAALATAEDELADWLETQLRTESELQTARQALATQDAALQAGERARTDCERRVEGQRRSIEERRLTAAETRLQQQALNQQLSELGADLEITLARLPAETSEPDWLARLAQVERRIDRLGPINLAAIEECAQLAERKGYLDAQNTDLLEALAVLENAMRKIDRETRARFHDTFERVNTDLGELFPRLFGGGLAHLALTGEDTLDAGVTIMAKPPGKRVGSLSLLSGGEKALTAIALIFAIFQLNPAPFCLLDEVDAPLDEANVGRFGALVQEMAARVQFIFVTHNKATMEIAEHLAGVTMQEPGVSRLVAVDVEAAVRLAAAG